MPLEGRPLASPAFPPADVLGAGVAADPEGTAIAGAEERLSWAELDRRSTSLACGYRALGLAPGDRLASLMPNRLELIVHYLACAKAALVAVPLNYRYTPREIEHALEVSGATALLMHAERAPELGASRTVSALRLQTIGYADDAAAGTGLAGVVLDELMRADGADLTPPEPAEPAVIFFTSGSTGPAKGVTHSHESLAWMFSGAVSALGLTPEDAFLPGSSMSHVGSFLWAFAALSAGARVIVARSFDAHEILPLLREYRPTILAMIPAALLALVRDHDATREDFAPLRVCRSGSDKVSTELLTEFAALAGFPIDEGYGMTEVGLATLNPPAGVIKQGSIGVPVDGFGISVRDEDGDEVEAERVGRVWLRSRSRMVGYWEAPDATAAVIRGEWLDSGDLARADEDGYLWFFGAQEADQRLRRLEHQPARGRRGSGRASGDRPLRRRGHTRRAPRRARARVRQPSPRRPPPPVGRRHRLLPRTHRLQGARGGHRDRGPAAQPDGQDRPPRPQAPRRGPPASAPDGLARLSVSSRLGAAGARPRP